MRSFILGLILFAQLGLASAARAAELTVFAAASLTNALQEITAGRSDVRFSFAASSTLARQIEQGAKADLFLSADEAWMDYLAKRDLIAAETRIAPLSNALVLVAPADRAAPVTLAPGLDLAALLEPGGRLVTGDPAHVPVGRYARQALERLGLWAVAEPRLARSENVRAALVLVERGEAPYGIVYGTDAALAPKVKVVATFPADSHAPITYPMVVVKARDSAAARELLALLTGPQAKSIYRRMGFLVR